MWQLSIGIDYTHAAFGVCTGVNRGGACRVVGGYDFVNHDADPMDDNLHGTHVAGIIGANDINIKGVAPGVTLYAYKVCNALGQCDTSDVIAALKEPQIQIRWLPSDHVDVANLSLGGPGTATDPLFCSG